MDNFKIAVPTGTEVGTFDNIRVNRGGNTTGASEREFDMPDRTRSLIKTSVTKNN